MPTLMNRAEYAAHRGVHPTAVTKWGNKGLLVKRLDESGKEKIGAEASDALVNAKVDVTTGRPKKSEAVAVAAAMSAPMSQPSTPGQLDLTAPRLSAIEQARLDLTKGKAEEQQLRNAQTMGQLVNLADYTQRASDMGRLMRERTHAIFRKRAERLASETDPRKITAMLADEFDEMLTELAKEIDGAADAERAADFELVKAEAQEAAEVEASEEPEQEEE